MFIASDRNNEPKLLRSGMFMAPPPDVREVSNLPIGPLLICPGLRPRVGAQPPRQF